MLTFCLYIIFLTIVQRVSLFNSNGTICFTIDLFILEYNALFLKSLKHEVLLLKDKNNISEEYIKTLDNPIKELLYEKLNIETIKNRLRKI